MTHPRTPRGTVVVLLLALALSGCSTAVDTELLGAVDAGWEGPMDIDPDTGAMTLVGFNEHIDDERPAWAAASDTTVAAAPRIGTGEEDHGPIEMRIRRPDGPRPAARITLTDLPDDSVDAIRYELALVKGDDGLYRLAGGTVSHRCKPGRGSSTTFGTRPCA